MFRSRILSVSCLTISLLLSEGLWAAAAAGRVTAPFLKIPMGVRATGMGEAFTAIADDDQAMVYNPAGLAQIDRPTVSLMHMQGFGGVNYEYLGLVTPSSLFGLDIWGSVGLSYRLLDIQSTELTRALPDGSFDTTQAAKNQSWSAGGSEFGIGWGWMANETVGVGIALKLVNQQVVEETETIGAVDIGAITFFPGLKGMRAALDIQNLGASGSEAPLPSRLRPGLGYKTNFGSSGEHHWIIAADAALPLGPSDEFTKMSVGTEFGFNPGRIHFVAARAGYRYPSDLGSLAGLTVGGGYGVIIAGTHVGLDYAYVPFGLLGDSHRMGLNLKFGEAAEKPMPTAAPKPRPRAVAKVEELLPPLNLQGDAGSRKSRMFWTPAGQPGVLGYNLYLAYKPQGPWYKLNKRPINGTAQVVGSLFNNITTYFVATSVGEDGRESRRSNVATVKPRAGASVSMPMEEAADGSAGVTPDELRKTTLPELP